MTGTSQGQGARRGGNYVTIAYRTATGAQLWVQRYNGPGNGGDAAAAVAVSPDRRTVFVTGSSTGTTTVTDYATIAYNAATGAQRGSAATPALATPTTTPTPSPSARAGARYS